MRQPRARREPSTSPSGRTHTEIWVSGAHQGGHREDSHGGEDGFDDDRVAVKGVHEPGPRTSSRPAPDEGDLLVQAQEEIVGEESWKCID